MNYEIDVPPRFYTPSLPTRLLIIAGLQPSVETRGSAPSKIIKVLAINPLIIRNPLPFSEFKASILNEVVIGSQLSHPASIIGRLKRNITDPR